MKNAFDVFQNKFPNIVMYFYHLGYDEYNNTCTVYKYEIIPSIIEQIKEHTSILFDTSKVK